MTINPRIRDLSPPPKKVLAGGGVCKLGTQLALRTHCAEPGLERALARLIARFREFRVDILRTDTGSSALPRIEIRKEPGWGSDEGYRLRIGEKGVLIEGSTASGLAHGIATLNQWIRLNESDLLAGRPTLPGLFVEDRPDFANRGVMLDISRGKIPTMQTLYSLVDLLSNLKINQLQLYTEHTFAYAGHEPVWRTSGAITPDEIRDLDRFCRDRFIELVPNQNSFGHFHRWLSHERYRDLAECPEGVAHVFSRDKEPFSLCPTDDRTVALLADLYGQLLPNFTSLRFNVGLDETFDLGLGRSSSICSERGKGRVYLDFLVKVADLARGFGRHIQFWGDIILNHPELIGELPRDAVALEWGYEADHPFADHLQRFTDSGRDFYVCPGTSSWQSLVGRTRNMFENIKCAARLGRDYGASGIMITDWGDYGHLQPLSVSFPGLLHGACLAWNTKADHSEQDLARLLDLHVFDDRESILGSAVVDLGNVYLKCDAPVINGTALFFLLRYPDSNMDHDRLKLLNQPGLVAARNWLEAIAGRLKGAAKPTLVHDELIWAADLCEWLTDLGMSRLEAGHNVPIPAMRSSVRSDLARSLAALIERYRADYPRRNRVSCLAESVEKLIYLHNLLGPRNQDR